MTWTVFEQNAGTNETRDDAPGRGGYSLVLVPLPSDDAIEWWESEYGENPRRKCYFDRHGEEIWDGEAAWHFSEHDSPEDARAECGQMELDKGGIGSPMYRKYTWAEINGRLDVRVVTAGNYDVQL